MSWLTDLFRLFSRVETSAELEDRARREEEDRRQKIVDALSPVVHKDERVDAAIDRAIERSRPGGK